MAATPPTIISIKHDFLTTQTRLFLQPVNPTRAWRQTVDQDGTSNLPEKVIDNALNRLNQRVRVHVRAVYSPQATRAIAEQIDQLYLTAAAAAVAGTADAGVADDDLAGLRVGSDLADAEIIASLPPTWDSEREATAYPAEAKRYGELVAQLQSLSAQRQEAAARVARLRRMAALLKPFNTTAAAADEDSGNNGVQENLVTRNGEVEAELQRMRMLLARVGGRVGQLPASDQPSRSSNDSLFTEGELSAGKEARAEVTDMELEERRKVGQLLDLF
ncbi:kinetochore Sim4 complex subunit Fta4 [Podospora didyma]|uniref:Kinetochore Sim4 complex subunit Fta4 n=1 Tax=Podospora didyma TaxID=330526 RepID=A0AAE0NBV3_9PEZI|nr:kinetochore Sim4 complex subunit Fta4 [Podospora didyma]